MKYSVQLATGRSIHLESLYFQSPYSGILEGSPEYSNAVALANHLKPAKRIWPSFPAYCLNSDSFDTWQKSKFPEVLVSAFFLSYEPKRGRSSDASALPIVWFQSEICPIMSLENQGLVKTLDWDAHAGDFDW